MENNYNLIKNKKNNEGYVVYGINFGKTDFLGEPVPKMVSSSDYDHNWAVMIEKVKVHSCGKELMRLFTLDNENESTKKKEFDPDTKLHSSLESAIQEAQDLFNIHYDCFINNYEKEIKKIKESYIKQVYTKNSYLSGKEYTKKERLKNMEIAKEAIPKLNILEDEIKKGSVNLKTFRYSNPEIEINIEESKKLKEFLESKEIKKDVIKKLKP